MRLWLRIILTVEALVCFTPAGILLAVGVFMIPVWVGILGGAAINSDIRGEMSAVGAVTALACIALVVAGILGVIGLVRVLGILLGSAREIPSLRRTRVFTIAGLLSLLVWVAGQSFMGNFLVALVGVPSLLAAVHIIYLARQHLFRNEESTPASAA
jgi:hypothetical protein